MREKRTSDRVSSFFIDKLAISSNGIQRIWASIMATSSTATSSTASSSPWSVSPANRSESPAASVEGLLLYLEALGLALSSSTDNLAVGASLGVSGRVLRGEFNLAISAANGLGALVAATGGHEIGQLASGAGAWVAASVFLYLAWQEASSLWRNEAASPLLNLAERGVASALAVPMTLNNLAGGVAGGVLGIGPLLAGSSACVASYIMMASGHFIGTHAHVLLRGTRYYWCHEGGSCLDVRHISASIFTLLALSQVLDKFEVAQIGPYHRSMLVAIGPLSAAIIGCFVLFWCRRRRNACGHDATARPGVREADTPNPRRFVAIAGALMRLRGALGEVAYISRKRSLLDELLLCRRPMERSSESAEVLEAAAAALTELRSICFVETDAELVKLADELGLRTRVDVGPETGVFGAIPSAQAVKAAQATPPKGSNSFLSRLRSAFAALPVPISEAQARVLGHNELM